MVVLEAWAYGKPVLMTPECNLPEGYNAKAAFRIQTDVESISAGIHSLLQASTSTLLEMGSCGRALVAQRFSWPKIAAQMKEVYEWVNASGSRPECMRK